MATKILTFNNVNICSTEKLIFAAIQIVKAAIKIFNLYLFTHFRYKKFHFSFLIIACKHAKNIATMTKTYLIHKVYKKYKYNIHIIKLQLNLH